MEIKPHVGVGAFTFGLRESDIVKALQEPTNRETETFSPDNAENLYLEYDPIGVQFTLSSEDDYRLTGITCLDAQHTVFGLQLIGENASMLDSAAVKQHLSDLVLEDDYEDLGSKDFYSEQHSLSIWVQNDVIHSITIFPEYDESGNEIIWPA